MTFKQYDAVFLGETQISNMPSVIQKEIIQDEGKLNLELYELRFDGKTGDVGIEMSRVIRAQVFYATLSADFINQLSGVSDKEDNLRGLALFFISGWGGLPQQTADPRSHYLPRGFCGVEVSYEGGRKRKFMRFLIEPIWNVYPPESNQANELVANIESHLGQKASD